MMAKQFSFKNVDPERVGMTKTVIMQHISRGGLNDFVAKINSNRVVSLFAVNCEPLSS